MPTPISSRKAVTVSFIVDLLDVATNLVVAWFTGSAVVFGEMAQGLADSAGSALLVIGERRATRPRDSKHPFGYAREAFFWSLLSAIAMLVIGAGLSAARGIDQLLHPQALENPLLAVAVLTLAVITNGYAVSLSGRKLVADYGSIRSIFQNLNEPLVKGAFLRDVIGTTTSILGLIALLLYQRYGIVTFDAVGALVAAAFMFAGSIALMMQARALITGRSLPPEDVERLRVAALTDPKIKSVNQLAAVYSGASEVLIDADLDLSESLNTTEIETLLDRLEHRLHEVLPGINRVRVLLNSPA